MRIGFRHIIAGYLLLFTYSGISGQELRLGINYKRSIIPKLEIDNKVQLRKINNHSKAHYAILQTGLNYEISKNMAIVGSIRYSTESGGIDEEFDEEFDEEINGKIRYTADFKLKTKRLKNDIRINNRFRYQHSVIDMVNDRNYIRNKFGIDYKLTKGMRPYVAIEPYLILKEQKIRKLRFYMGSEFKLLSDELEFCFIIEVKSKDGDNSIVHKVGIHYIF